MSYHNGLGLQRIARNRPSSIPEFFSTLRVYNPNVNWTQRGPRPGDMSNTMLFKGFNGLRDTCQWPQPGVPMYYPACEGTPPGQAAQPDPYSRDVYAATDVPGLVLPAPSNCIDSTGNVVMNDSCVNANLAVQQQNFQRIAQYNSDPAYAASFWPGTPAASIPAATVPVAVSAPPTRVTSSPLVTGVPSTPAASSPSQSSTPPPAVPSTGSGSNYVPVATVPATATPASSTNTSGYIDPGIVNAVTNSSGFEIAGYDIPWWGLAAAAAGALFLFGGKR